jgi:hypothetical protein
LYPRLAPNLRLFTLTVDFRDNLVEVAVRVHSLPERLTVCGVISTRVVLLSTVVDEGDTTASQGENSSAAELGIFTGVVVKETSIIVIVHEETESIDIVEVGSLSIVAALD